MKFKFIALILLSVSFLFMGYKLSVANDFKNLKPVKAKKQQEEIYSNFVLKNGMQVFVIPNPTVPAVSHMVWYRVGAKDEPQGKSGITHLLEHLLFKGTAKFPKGVFSKAVSESGGQENAFTGQDFTAFYQNVPKEKLGLMMEMEADRMMNLEFNQAEFETERDVVMEEFRMRVENNPRSLMIRELDAALYRNHPYRKQVIGWEDEILALTREDALDYYNKFYDPKNAILVVAGDVTEQEVRELAEKHYAPIPANFKPIHKDIVEPKRASSAEIIYEDERVAQAEYWQKFIAPSFTSKEAEQKKQGFALEVLSRLLGGGTSSVLYRSIVVEQQLASAIGSAYSGHNAGPAEFTIFAYPQSLKKLEDMRVAIINEIEKIKNGAIDPARLQAIKKSMVAEQIYDREGLQSMAYKIGQNYIIGLSPEFIYEWEEGIEAVTAEDVAHAAKVILQENKSVSAILKTAEKGESE